MNEMKDNKIKSFCLGLPRFCCHSHIIENVNYLLIPKTYPAEVEQGQYFCSQFVWLNWMSLFYTLKLQNLLPLTWRGWTQIVLDSWKKCSQLFPHACVGDRTPPPTTVRHFLTNYRSNWGILRFRKTCGRLCVTFCCSDFSWAFWCLESSKHRRNPACVCVI